MPGIHRAHLITVEKGLKSRDTNGLAQANTADYWQAELEPTFAHYLGAVDKGRNF